MKRVIITATPEFVRTIFQIPDGAIVREMRHSFENPGIIEFALEGCG